MKKNTLHQRLFYLSLGILGVLTILYYVTMMVLLVTKNVYLVDIADTGYHQFMKIIDMVIRYSFIREIAGFLFLCTWMEHRDKEQGIYGMYLWLMILPVTCLVLFPQNFSPLRGYFYLPIFLIVYRLLEKKEISVFKQQYFMPIFILLCVGMGIYFYTYWKLTKGTIPGGTDLSDMKTYQGLGSIHIYTGIFLYVIPLREMLCFIGLKYPSKRNVFCLTGLGIVTIVLYYFLQSKALSIGPMAIKNIGYLLGVIGAYQSLLFWKEGSYHK